MTKILIYGGNGWIGGMMCVLLSKKNIKFVKSNVRVNDKKAVEEELDIEKPTHVMSFIGRTHGNHNGTNYTTIDFLEQKGRILGAFLIMTQSIVVHLQAPDGLKSILLTFLVRRILLLKGIPMN